MSTVLQHPRDGRNRYYDYLSVGYYAPGENMYMVGGTNTRGRHGKGVAMAMSLMYGYPEKMAEGLAGRAYGIPTREIVRGKVVTLPLPQIKEAVQRFVQFTRANPDKSWLVTAVGTGNAEVPDKIMAPMFRGAINCWFTTRWYGLVEEVLP